MAEASIWADPCATGSDVTRRAVARVQKGAGANQRNSGVDCKGLDVPAPQE